MISSYKVKQETR